MYLEVIECLHQVKSSICGLPGVVFTVKIVSGIIYDMYSFVLFPRINRMSDALHQRSVIERNPRIKRQIKFFLLRRLHEHYHFKLYGMCHINLRQLHSLSSKAIGYLVVQILLKLNKKLT
ncbi:uncharacterized protein LOC111033322 isoform X2 [Myzus persicae]|uniref:uncharacterized protein LOC111033322 isoform X2 n=1 Tax=Myzus persicae TaxID=13164 RepID=UPI000B938AA1|nr:uncharacterized protein LOC111033322 isoform X2 [Myzus persicae]